MHKHVVRSFFFIIAEHTQITLYLDTSMRQHVPCWQRFVKGSPENEAYLVTNVPIPKMSSKIAGNIVSVIAKIFHNSHVIFTGYQL